MSIKESIREHILTYLFKQAETQVISMIRKLIVKSAIEQNFSAVSQCYVINNGAIYYSDKVSKLFKTIQIEITKSHKDKFNLLCEMKTAIEYEKIEISSGITAILNHCSNLRDIRLFFPDKYLDQTIINAIDKPSDLAKDYLTHILITNKKQKFTKLLKNRELTNLLIKNLRV